MHEITNCLTSSSVSTSIMEADMLKLSSKHGKSTSRYCVITDQHFSYYISSDQYNFSSELYVARTLLYDINDIEIQVSPGVDPRNPQRTSTTTGS